MTRKQFFTGICVLMTVLGVLLCGCPTEDKADHWKKVTKAKDLYGTWEGSSSIIVPEIDLESIFGGGEIPEGLPFSVLAKAPLDYSVRMKIGASEIETKITIDCKRYLDATMGPLTQLVWGLFLKDRIAKILAETAGIMPDEIEDIQVTDDYKIIGEGTFPVELTDDTLDDIGEGADLYLNQDKTKLKIVTETDGTIQELILHRK